MTWTVPVTTGLISCVLLLSGCGGGDSGGSIETPPDLAGFIDIESGTRVDSDTADDIRLGESVDNGTPGSAQALPPGATAGGYLSFDGGTYNIASPGSFNFFEDPVDFYATELSPGDRIAVQVFLSPDQGMPLPDRTLRILKQESGVLVVKYSDTTSDPRALMVTLPAEAEPGPYLIEVSTTGGVPFRYVLTLAGKTSGSVMNTSYTSAAFMVDEAIVSFESDPGGSAMASAMAVSERRDLGRGAWLMRRDGGPQNPTAMSATEIQAARRDTLDWIRELRSQAGVAAAEPNYLYTSQQVSPDNDPLYDRQWNLPLTRAPMAWQAALDVGLGIGIAVFDTGLFRSSPTTGGAWHPDLVANIQVIPGEIMDYVSGDLDIDQEPGRDTNPADPGDGKTRSSNFHGTHVAGIAGAADNEIGVLGMAPSATIYPVRVLGRDGVGSSADLIDALNWAAGRSEIDVINLSLGGLGPSDALKNAIDAAWSDGNGKLVVAAAGNQGTDQPTYPAAYPNVIGVGAVDGAGERASYSNVGDSVDVVAPGGDASRDANQDGAADVIISTWGRDDSGEFEPAYAGLQGTSMAAPHVAGIYALMKAEVSLTPGEFRSLLRNGDLTEAVGPAFEYGAGLINALAAMDAALEGNFPITLGASPSALQFNSAVLSAELEFSAYPEGEPITITRVSTGADWLKLGDTPASPTQPLAVSVDTSGLDNDKRYSTELVIAYDPDNGDPDTLAIPVSLRLGTSADERDAGRHYVLLVSADDDRDTIEQIVVSASDGQYKFAFDQVEPGEYFLVAGTDMDNNGLICESGEACAEFPVNGLPQKIVIGDKPVGGVRLSTSFRRPTIAALGLPRVGFEGYRLKSDGGEQQATEPVRTVESKR